MQLAAERLRLLRGAGAAADGGVAPFEHGVTALARVAAAAREILKRARPRLRLTMLQWLCPVLAACIAVLAAEPCMHSPTHLHVWWIWYCSDASVDRDFMSAAWLQRQAFFFGSMIQHSTVFLLYR